jgi:hypothetical protein
VVRKSTLASVLTKASPGLRLNERLKHEDGETVFRHACKMGLEGIVSKRKDSPYRSGRSPDWLKMKNPACAAVKREAEEDWGKEGGDDWQDGCSALELSRVGWVYRTGGKYALGSGRADCRKYRTRSCSFSMLFT